MQEEVTQKTIALVIKTAKLDANVLKFYHAFSVLSACGGSDTSALQPSRRWHPV